MKRIVLGFWILLAAALSYGVTLDKPTAGKYWAGSGEGREMLNAALDALNAGKVEWRGAVTTTQRDALTGVAVGDLCYNTTAGQYQAYDGSAWGTLGSSGGGDLSAADLDTLAELNAIVGDATLVDASHSHAASEIASGTLADARVAESNVTQHQGALAITQSQITDLPAQVSAGEITSGTETALRRFAPADVKAFVDTHAGGGGDLSATDVDTLSELNAIVVDATLRDIDIASLTDGATVALDASLGSTFRLTLGGNRTLAAPTNPTDGQVIDLEITQDGTGGRTLTLPTGAGGLRFGTDAPSNLFVPSTTAGKTDYLTLKYRASADRWDVLSFIRGY